MREKLFGDLEALRRTACSFRSNDGLFHLTFEEEEERSCRWTTGPRGCQDRCEIRSNKQKFLPNLSTVFFEQVFARS